MNGCSTAGQVRRLLEIGVPAVIATNASVEDKSATEFSIRFYRNICQRKMTIKQAFDDALGPAQTMTNKDLKITEKPARGLVFLEKQDSLTPLWELFCKHPDHVNINPLPVLSVETPPSFEPNEQLTQIIFEALDRAGNKKVRDMKSEEASGSEIVTLNDKQKAIIKYLPFPVSAHLQKLFTSIEGSDGFDKMSLRRLEQIGRACHIVMEFIGFIMIAQLRENDLVLPLRLKKRISNCFYLTAQQRATFDYLPFVTTTTAITRCCYRATIKL
ncbi:MAG: CHAT domain-containing protein [Williamsia sp.]|nr:CHAT domain-containing protein [Williamsia sp.]